MTTSRRQTGSSVGRPREECRLEIREVCITVAVMEIKINGYIEDRFWRED